MANLTLLEEATRKVEAAKLLLKEGAALLIAANETADFFRQTHLVEQAAQKHGEANSLMEQRTLLMTEYRKSGLAGRQGNIGDK